MQLFTGKRGSGIFAPCLLVFIFFLGAKIYPAPLSLTLEDAVNRAVAENINLQKSVMDLELAQYRVDNLWSELFPSFSLTGGFTLLPATPLFTEPGFSFNERGQSYSITFGITMQLNAGIPHSMRLTELAYHRGLLDFENARRRLSIDITKTFNTLLAAKENLANLEETLNLAERQLEKNRIARANGLIGELPWLQSRLSVETARFNLLNNQSSYNNSLREFLTILGLDRNLDVVLEGSISPVPVTLDPEALILEYLPRRPDIVNQRLTIERLELSRTQSNMSAKAPSLSLSASWSGNPQRNTGLTGRFRDSLSGSLSVTVPIDPWIPGTRSNQSLRSVDVELEKARLDLVNTESTARSNIRNLTESIRNSWNSIEIAKLRVEIAQRTYELSDAGFQSGVVEYLSLENTRNDLADAQFRLLQSELAYLNLLLDLASALNVDLETLTRS